MFSKPGTNKALQMALFACFALACLVAMTRLISAQPTAANAVGLFSSADKINGGDKTTDESAEHSFHQFINSKPTESTIIGEIKPNASALELMLLRNKIANTIMSMQERDKQEAAAAAASAVPSHQTSPTAVPTISTSESTRAECYIEVTKVEKVPGKCHRASSGLPICQSDNYMTISNECS